MSRCAASAVAIAAMVAGQSTALAKWSAPMPLPGAQPRAVAVDGRGNAAVAWWTRPKPFQNTVYVAVIAAGGHITTHTLWSSRNADVGGISVAVGHGEVTVAWDTIKFNATYSQGATVHAAWGPIRGHWRQSRTIGHSAPDSYSGPPDGRFAHVAVAPDGEVLLVWDDDSKAIRGVAMAWRSPRHGFGPVQLLSRSSKLARSFWPLPQFDARGTAYVWSACSAAVLSARPHSHHFGAPVVLTPGDAVDFVLSISAPGQGLASWIRGACSTDEAAGDTPGPVLASVLRGGAFQPPLQLTPAGTQGYYSNAVAAAGGGTVNWVAWNGTFSTPFQANGSPGATVQLAAGQPGPLTRDGAGDLVLTLPQSAAFHLATPPPVIVRPVGGGPDQPGPTGEVLLIAAAPSGRGVAVAWSPSMTSGAVSIWRP